MTAILKGSVLIVEPLVLVVLVEEWGRRGGGRVLSNLLKDGRRLRPHKEATGEKIQLFVQSSQLLHRLVVPTVFVTFWSSEKLLEPRVEVVAATWLSS